MLNGERSNLRVKVAPAKSAHFSSTRPGRRGDVEKVTQLGIALGGLADQLSDLLYVGRVEIRFREPRRRCVCRRIGVDPAPKDGLTERSANNGVDLANSRRG